MRSLALVMTLIATGALGQGDDSRLPLALPYHTPEMMPGPVEPRSLDIPQLVQPLFLIGADEHSLRWLAIHRDVLIELGATGLLVAATSLADLERVATVGAGLPITPAAATTLAAQFGLTHYPLLLSREGIEQ